VPREKLFNPLKRKLLRQRISTVETIFGAAFIFVLLLVAALVLAQSDDYDPADRDISPEQLQGGRATGPLYKSPMKLWSESGGAGGGERPPDLGSLPPAILNGGWQLDGRVESYDPSNLYEKINGAAELYLAYGFLRLEYLTIAKGDHAITLELYDQGRFHNSLGLFAGQRRPEQAVRELGAISYYATPVGAIGRYGEYYFKIAGNGEADAVLAKAEELLASMAELPADSFTAPAPYALMTEKLGAAPADLEYRRDNVFQYEFASEFWFAPIAGEGAARYFIHESSDPATAEALYRKLLEEQKWEHAVAEEKEDRVILVHEYLKTFFALGRRGKFLVGVEGAANGEVARRHLGRLEEVVQSGG
jgi:hypothetical protein